MNVLRIERLSKRYGSIDAVRNLSLQIESGQVFGLLGPNGSGKTTTLAILLDVIKADSGRYLWFDGLHSDQARRKIGAILEHPTFYPNISALENLKIIQKIKRSTNDQFESILSMTGLLSRQHSLYKTYSLGMKQRLAIASTLIGDPEVLILDEPTNGLDPEGIADIRNLIHEIAAKGKTILLASHILTEVEKVCTHVGILKDGRLLASGPVGAILGDDKIVELSASSTWTDIKDIRQHSGTLQIRVKPSLDVATINTRLMKAGVPLTHLIMRKRALEAEFLEITK